MKNVNIKIIAITLFIVAIIVILQIAIHDTEENVAVVSEESTVTLDEAEWIAYSFMRDLIVSIPPFEMEEEFALRLFDQLSSEMQAIIPFDQLQPELVARIQFTDLPQQAIHVAKVIAESSEKKTVILQIPYTERSFTFRAVDIVLEQGLWKVADIRTKLDPAELPPPPPPTLPPSQMNQGI